MTPPRGPRWALDGLLALGAAAAEVGEVFGDDRSPRVVAVVLAFVAGAVLLARRRAPVPTLGVSLAAVLGVAIAGVTPLGLAPLIALYTVASLCERRVSLVALAFAILVAVAATLVVPSGDELFDPLVGAACSVGAWGLGIYVETRRKYRRELDRRATSIERERQQLARLAAHEERAGIARELHDIVTHSVSVMLVGVRGARDVLRSDPDVADATLGKVETSAEQSLAELRRILTLLREPAVAAESRPQPSLAQLDDLVAEYRSAGLPVVLERTGDQRRLPGGVELSVYRIVQEALTNVLKHARARNAVSRSRSGSLGSTSRSSTTAHRRAETPPCPVTAWSVCASASPCSAASWSQGTGRAAAFASRRGSRSGMTNEHSPSHRR
jgi:signal transduction histidine kinase